MISAQDKVLFAGHGWHLIEILGFFLTSIVGVWLAEVVRRRPRSNSVVLRQQPLLWLVGLFGAAAGAIHFDVMPEHFEESALYGSFFLVSAILQIAYSGWLVVSRSRVLLVVGAIGNTALAALWLFTRTVEIPLGPAAGDKESFGALDVACSALEILMAVGALTLLYRSRARLQPAITVTHRPTLVSPPVHFP
jgi:uncharacterized integral membrane protein